MTQDQVFVPKTRAQLGLPPFDPTKEDILGSTVAEEVKKEFWEAIGDSPIGATIGAAMYLVRRIDRDLRSLANSVFSLVAGLHTLSAMRLARSVTRRVPIVS